MAGQGAASPEGAASPAVASAPSASAPTTEADGLVPIALVVGSDSAEADDDETSAGPGWADRLKRGLSSDKGEKNPKRKAGAPGEDEITAFLGDRLLRWLMLGYVYWLTAPLDLDPEAQRRLVATPEERRTMVAPFGRMLAHSEWNERVGRRVLDSEDAIDAIVTFAFWVDSTRPVLRERRHQTAARREDPRPPQGEPDESSGPGTGGVRPPPGGGFPPYLVGGSGA